jgi:purine-nucleoside phosphorylase
VLCSTYIRAQPQKYQTNKFIKMEDVLAAPNAYVRATETAQYVRSQLPEALQNPKVAIVCGSGLGGLADTIEPSPKVELAYGSIPNFPKSTGMWTGS